MEPFQLVCASPEMRRIAETIRKSGRRTLLLTGETGVGKDVLARWAHTISPHALGPFVPINCAAIQESLWESEIFGHAKGAFTGADVEKEGQVEKAAGGTLFLNEIGDMPLPTQAKLLTFLDTHEFQRVGETETRSVNARVIAATNRDLEKEIEAKRFRRDLFYRLAVVHAKIPPLRERPADVLGLAKTHLRDLAQERNQEPIRISSSTRDLLVMYPWKGNARELGAIIETAFERCLESGGGTLIPDHFAPEMVMSDLPSEGTRSRIGGHQEERGASEESLARVGSSAPSQAAHLSVSIGTLLNDPSALRSFLDQYKNLSGRWNLSAAHRALVDCGHLQIGRRAFALRVNKMFPEE